MNTQKKASFNEVFIYAIYNYYGQSNGINHYVIQIYRRKINEG